MGNLSKSKKILYGVLFGLDVALTIFFLVVSIVMLVTMPSLADIKLGNYQKNFIGWFQQNPTWFLIIVVLPLIALFVVNIIVLVKYVKSSSTKKKVALNDLSEEDKAKLREALMKDLSGEDKKE